jgi:hypothetical protein
MEIQMNNNRTYRNKNNTTTIYILVQELHSVIFIEHQDKHTQSLHYLLFNKLWCFEIN